MSRSLDEKQEFAKRLKQALKRSSKKVETPAELALQFNLRHPNESISPQAAQKWLSGASRPTPDKIATLAAWLKVSAQWLRYGIAEKVQPATARPVSRKPATSRETFSEEEVKLIQRIRTLSAHQRYLVAETVEQFALGQEMWHD
jgi:transcriptional regulator with XRE-family HTH domain